MTDFLESATTARGLLTSVPVLLKSRPVSWVSNWSSVVRRNNRVFNNADDTFLVVPAANSNALEVKHSEAWAAKLQLNRSKSKVVIFSARGKRGKSSCVTVYGRLMA